jgi:hypothetical protein
MLAEIGRLNRELEAAKEEARAVADEREKRIAASRRGGCAIPAAVWGAHSRFSDRGKMMGHQGRRF